MKTKLFLLPMLAILALSFTHFTNAETQVEVSVTDGDFEMLNTDLSHLAVGESEILYSNGKEITLTRTESGVDVLVDGEELDADFAFLKSECNVEINVDAHCDDCEVAYAEMNVIMLKSSGDTENMQVTCMSGDSDGHYVWASDDVSEQITRTIEVRTSGEELHEGSEHTVIMIKKHVEVVN